jgi:hypothetical protein
MNVEVAHGLTEQEEHEERAEKDPFWLKVLEIFEVVLLAVVAIATAWSGYQATRWDGQESLLYGQSNRDRFEADAASTYGGQVLAADAGMFTAWLQAHAAGDSALQALYVKRFTPDYRVAFDAWLATDPFANPKAPAGPGTMPQYHNPYFAHADDLNAQASTTFDEGTSARETGDKYVRDTVLFASVLFLVALAQRLRIRAARVTLTTISFAMLGYVLVSVLLLPRI